MDVRNKVIVITGAGSGIGRALAIELGKEGAALALTDYNAETLDETVNMAQKAGAKRITRHVFDVSQKEAIEKFVCDAFQAHEAIDILINNAGVALGKISVDDVTYEEFEWLFNINFWGMVYGTKAFLPHLKTRPEASIVNISSVFGIMGVAYQAPYCASKFAIRGFNESLRIELKETHPSINVISVHPGGIKTNIVRSSRNRNEAERIELAREFDEKMARTSPESAAKTIIRGIKRNKGRVLIGMDAGVIDKMVRLFPEMYQKIAATVRRQQKI